MAETWGAKCAILKIRGPKSQVCKTWGVHLNQKNIYIPVPLLWDLIYSMKNIVHITCQKWWYQLIVNLGGRSLETTVKLYEWGKHKWSKSWVNKLHNRDTCKAKIQLNQIIEMN